MAVLDARVVGRQSNVEPERLADLMDAIHNIPSLVQHWEHCDEELLKEMLLDYERRWQKQGPCLRTIYEQALADGKS